jgi:hypothetical protein
MSAHGDTEETIRRLISTCSEIEPSNLANSDVLKQLSELLSGIPSENCEDIAEIFYEMCAGFNEHNKLKIESVQSVLILSLVEKMNFPDSKQAEGFHYWADHCSCELIDIGGSFFEQEDENELKLVLGLLEVGAISCFAQTSLIGSLYVLETQDMKVLLNKISHPLVWMGAFANSEFARGETVSWLIENIPNFDAYELVALIEESPIGNIAWEYPYLHFSREALVTDDVIEYLIKVLESGYVFQNKKEAQIASTLIEYEDEYDQEPQHFLERAIKLCESKDEVRTAAQNSTLESLADAVA